MGSAYSNTERKQFVLQEGRVMARVVSRRLLCAWSGVESGVHVTSCVNLCGICGGQGGIWIGFFFE
jgi:hypothetical protein